jgi:hypothetical protein
LKACNLIPTILRGNAGLEKSGPNGIEAGEFLTVAKKRCASFDLASGSNQFINAIKFLFAQINRHAEFPQITVRAGYFEGLRIHVPHFGTNLQAILISVKFVGLQSLRVLTGIKTIFPFSGIFASLAKEYS